MLRTIIFLIIGIILMSAHVHAQDLLWQQKIEYAVKVAKEKMEKMPVNVFVKTVSDVREGLLELRNNDKFQDEIEIEFGHGLVYFMNNFLDLSLHFLPQVYDPEQVEHMIRGLGRWVEENQDDIIYEMRQHSTEN